MTRYIVKRLVQGIPLLFIISMILFVLLMNMGDPVATMGGRNVTRPAERLRLTRQLGLDKPLYQQYLFWLVGNDWAKFDLDGDGVAESHSIGEPLCRSRPLSRSLGAGALLCRKGHTPENETRRD